MIRDRLAGILAKASTAVAPKRADVAMPRGGRETALSGVTIGNVVQGRQVLVSQDGTAAFEWFGPGTPLQPIAPPSVAGRAFDFPVAYNTTTQPRAYEAISFGMLRAIADAYDLLRLVIETRKDQIEAFEWEIVPKEGKSVDQATVTEANEFFQSPDKEHLWPQWLRMVLEDLFVLDAIAIYPRQTRGGGLYSLELVDGGTIKRVLDASGRTPLPPDHAFQQVLHGLPAVDYTLDELLYTMRNPRTNRVYGYGPVEQIVMTVNMALRRQWSQLQYFTEGNIPEAIAGVPESWSVDNLKQFQIYWDTMLEGNTGQRRHMKFVPLDPSKIKEMRPDILKDEFDEWLARVICFAFSISPTALIKQVNRAVAQTVADEAKAEGLVPLLNFLRTFFNGILATRYGNPSLEFRWNTRKEIAPKDQAEVDKIYLDADVYDVDFVRKRQGLPPLTDEEKAAIKEKQAAAAPFGGGGFGGRPPKPGEEKPTPKDPKAALASAK